MLTVNRSSAPSHATDAAATATRMRSAIWSASSSPTSGISTRNSSPPTRPTRSDSRVPCRTIRARAPMTRSPAAWPWTSLTRLKWSASIIIAARCAGWPARKPAKAASASSRMTRRLRRPVSASVSARWRSACMSSPIRRARSSAWLRISAAMSRASRSRASARPRRRSIERSEVESWTTSGAPCCTSMLATDLGPIRSMLRISRASGRSARPVRRRTRADETTAMAAPTARMTRNRRFAGWSAVAAEARASTTQPSPG